MASFSNLYALSNIGASANRRVNGSDQATQALVREIVGSESLELIAGEAIQYSTNGGTTWINATYLGTLDGGISFTSGGTQYLTTNNTYANNANVGSVVASPFVICFLTGTLINTPAGVQPVETLQPGDLVITSSGESPVKFVSRNRYAVDLLDSLDSLPVSIRAGALGEGLPHRDLYVTGNHAILIDGHLVHASALVNNSTIVRTTVDDWRSAEALAYYNIELEEHSIIHAEGQPVETYVDNVPRQSWENYAHYLELYGEGQPIQEMNLPRVKFARQLPNPLKQKFVLQQEPVLAAV